MYISCRNHGDILLTQARVAAEQVQDALAGLPFVAAAVTRAPLRHVCAAVAHVVGSHDGACVKKEDKKEKLFFNFEHNICPSGRGFSFLGNMPSNNNISPPRGRDVTK